MQVFMWSHYAHDVKVHACHFQVKSHVDKHMIRLCVLLHVCFFRSLCEDPLDAERQKTEEEEDDNKEKHAEPVLQRIVQLWGFIWANSGTEYWVDDAEMSVCSTAVIFNT